MSCEAKNSDNTITTSVLALVTNNNSNSNSTVTYTSSVFCKIFVTNSITPYNAGITGFASHCTSSSYKPSGGGTYKAMASDGTTRRACSTANCSSGTSEQINWVLKTNTIEQNQL
ncbi:DUF1554 domain-containing protein [Leptospira meyeri]|uniref:DUF1554 domain-containing protein n=1 Tax=Leptospira meyeri TaxID=29508 RepID=UPI000C2B23B9|nr:DUF1554 domain-containing protein [Leptospira meyeri]PJZ81259.1 hypothetical protein CH359_09275 [Leptospira meyeri]PJZ96764.1 hypothetical protein CH358_10945 [Leptospira meyeri]PKA10345.1 hypothetical protein CH372_19915 [Leptospira meyeri]TGL14974.1 DUF1554 domain-containing protein [Leptospira meyeri]